MKTPPGEALRNQQKIPGVRHSRSIRFSDSEWHRVEQAASWEGILVGEFVRSGALAAAKGYDSTSHETQFPPAHAALIKAIYRAVYLLATITREKLIEAGRREDLDGIVAEAQEAMAETMSKAPGG